MLKREKNLNQKTYQRIVSHIHQLIREGSLAPGDKILSERQLVESLGVSRNCIREALSVLETMGLIDVSPGEGTYVKKASLESIIEPLATVLWKEIEGMDYLIEARRIIEVNALELACLRADESDLFRIRESALQVIRDFEAGVSPSESDSNFHLYLVSACKNPILLELTYMLSALMKARNTGPFKNTVLTKLAKKFNKQHLEIYKAVKNHDAQKAKIILLEHLDLSEKELMHESDVAEK